MPVPLRASAGRRAELGEDGSPAHMGRGPRAAAAWAAIFRLMGGVLARAGGV